MVICIYCIQMCFTGLKKVELATVKMGNGAWGAIRIISPCWGLAIMHALHSYECQGDGGVGSGEEGMGTRYV